MTPRIQKLGIKKLAGIKIKMSFAENKTVELWRNFISRRKEIKNNIGTELYSVEVYDKDYFRKINQNKEFEKWAAVEVTDFINLPAEMGTITLHAGLYAVFIHNGHASEG